MAAESAKQYFSEAGAERRARLRAELDAAAAGLDTIAATLGVEDQELIERIHALGFNGDSARVFDLLPLVHVAWADGKIQKNERSTIFAVLEQRAIEPESDAWMIMETLLEQRPSDSFLGQSLAVLRVLVADQAENASSLVDLCLTVADASGGLLGLGERRSSEERALIEHVAVALGPSAEDRFKERLKI